VASIEKNYVSSGKPFDIIQELDELHTRIILTSAFGLEHVSEVKLPYLENGQTHQKSLG
jgi:hypothetical protein